MKEPIHFTPAVTFLLPDGSLHRVAAGGWIGRTPSAALVLDDARISEAHAMVSLRGPDLKILGLRGRLRIDGAPATDAVLEEGMVVEPARGLELVVADVRLPTAVMALALPGLPPLLLAGTTSILTRPAPAAVTRYDPAASAWLWSAGPHWRLHVGGAPARDVAPGVPFMVDGVRCELVAQPLAQAGAVDTVAGDGGLAPLTVRSHYDVVHVFGPGDVAVHFDGQLGRLIAEVAAVGAPVAWYAVASAIWPDEADRGTLRSRWDVGLSRIRRKLRLAGLRGDLLRAAGIGLIELFLRPGDRLDDRG